MSPSATPTPTGASLAEWQRRQTGDGGLAGRLVRLVLMPPRTALYERCDARLVAMVERGVLDEVARAMHSLKSSAAMIGASRVEEIAIRVEETATEQQADTLASQLDDLDSAVAQVESYLETRGKGC